MQDIRSRLSEVEKNLYSDPYKIKDQEIFDFLYYLVRRLSSDTTSYPIDIITQCPDILEATLDRLYRDIEVQIKNPETTDLQKELSRTALKMLSFLLLFFI